MHCADAHFDFLFGLFDILGVRVAGEFITEGDRVVSLGTYSGTFKKTGRSFSAAFAHVWTVRGDKLASFNMHTDTAKVLEAVQS